MVKRKKPPSLKQWAKWRDLFFAKSLEEIRDDYDGLPIRERFELPRGNNCTASSTEVGKRNGK